MLSSNCKIEIDGGVSDKNAKKLLEKGADVLSCWKSCL